MSLSVTTPWSVLIAVCIEYIMTKRGDRGVTTAHITAHSLQLSLKEEVPLQERYIHTIRLMRPGVNMKVSPNCQNQAWFTRPR